MKLYTKTGDDGTTGLLGGSRAMKSSARISAIGAVDEANCALGFAGVALAGEPDLAASIAWIQARLFDVGAELAAPPDRQAEPRAAGSSAETLEAEIDAFTAEVPPLANFILPGGGEAAARLHLARAAVRRAERALARLRDSGEPVRTELFQFVNRLSDWAFAAARAASRRAGIAEVVWREGR